MDCNWSALIQLDPEPEANVDPVEETPDVGSNANPRPVEGTPADVGSSHEACDFLASSGAAEHYGLVNWDDLQIENTYDKEGEGMIDVINEDQLFRLLGLRADGDQHDNPSKTDTQADAQAAAERDSTTENRNTNMDIDTTGAAIPVDDHVPGEEFHGYDPNNPSMDIGTTYPNMKEFRLAMKQFAINKQFEYCIVKTDPTRFIANCKDEDCPWHINGRRQPDQVTVKVTALIEKHECTSSAERYTTTPTAIWVKSKAIPLLKEDSTIGAKKMRELLEKQHKCKITYDVAWAGRKMASDELFGTWGQSFAMLFNWRAEAKEA